MTETEKKTLSLADFASRAVEGEEIEQELRNGKTLVCRVFTPTQADAIAVQGIMADIVKVAQRMKDENDAGAEEASLAFKLGFECLRACVRDESGIDIPDPAFVDLFGQLPAQSKLMLKCQDLCGVSMMVVPTFTNEAVVRGIKESIEEQEKAAQAAAQAAKINKRARKRKKVKET